MKRYLALLFSLAGALLAHHSFDAEYGRGMPVSLKGTVTKLEWMNPHIWLYLDVKDASGAVSHWECEGGPPNSLVRGGWTKDLIKAGDEISLEGTLAKDGTKTCNTRSVTLSSGRRLGGGSSEGKQ